MHKTAFPTIVSLILLATGNADAQPPQVSQAFTRDQELRHGRQRGGRASGETFSGFPAVSRDGNVLAQVVTEPAPEPSRSRFGDAFVEFIDTRSGELRERQSLASNTYTIGTLEHRVATVNNRLREFRRLELVPAEIHAELQGRVLISRAQDSRLFQAPFPREVHFLGERETEPEACDAESYIRVSDSALRAGPFSINIERETPSEVLRDSRSGLIVMRFDLDGADCENVSWSGFARARWIHQEAPRIASEGNDLFPIGFPAISPDGRTLAMTEETPNATLLTLVDIASRQSQRRIRFDYASVGRAERRASRELNRLFANYVPLRDVDFDVGGTETVLRLPLGETPNGGERYREGRVSRQRLHQSGTQYCEPECELEEVFAPEGMNLLVFIYGTADDDTGETTSTTFVVYSDQWAGFGEALERPQL